jgi:hypothetical protein
LRVRLMTLIDLCARLYFDDHLVSVVLRCYRQVDDLLTEVDPSGALAMSAGPARRRRRSRRSSRVRDRASS